MIRTVQRELSATSNVNAPKFNFREYVRGHVYNNNSTDIDFVTDNGNLYVPVSDNVTANKDSAKLDSQFMLLVAKGEQGEQGVKGEKGADGRTPAVYARFDGKQMVFYTNVLDEEGNIVYNDNGTPATRRMAATNDLTGPSWKPELVNDTIVWHKTKDDEAPKSIPLSNLVKQSAPVLLRVNSDNTRRMDEMDESGPANYIQWKYEGDEFWNNLISISELMNLTLAGVSIWQDENDHKWHFGHREVEKASYAASHTGKQIITDVELGEVLYDAGVIPESNYDLEIYQLTQDACDLKRRVKNIENELPKFVKSVTVNGQKHRPDENGDVALPDYYTKEESDDKYQPKGNYQPAGDYIKKSDLKFEVRSEEDGRFLYMSLDNGSTWTKVYEATCACTREEDPTIYYTIYFEIPNPSTATMSYSGSVKYPGDTIRVPAGTTVILEADADGYQHYRENKLINADYHFRPVLTQEVVPETKYEACIEDETGLADRIYIGTTSANKQQSCLGNLSNGTTVRGKATRSGYEDKTVSGTINNDNLTLYITGDWVEKAQPTTEYKLKITPSATSITVNDCITVSAEIQMKTSGAKVEDVNATYRTSETSSDLVNITDNQICGISDGRVTIYGRCTYQGVEYGDYFTLTINKKSEPEPTTYTVTTNKNGGNCSVKPDSLTISKTPNGTYSSSLEFDDDGTSNIVYIKATKSGKDNITGSITVNSATVITLGMGTTTCAWDEEPTTKYEVSIGNTCDADTVYLTKTEGGSSIGQTYQAEENEIVWLHAEKSGKKTINKSSDMIKDNYQFVINCNEWEDETEPEVEVTGISLNNSTMSLTYASCDGHTYGTTSGTLTATITPSDATNKNVNWTTNNSSVATVSGGVVTAKGVGTAIITATAVGNTSKTATCRVTVTAASVPATGISLNKQTTTLTVGSTETLEATLTPSCSTSAVTWSSNGTGVATVDSNGKVTAINPGTATITAKANGKSTTCTITVSASPIATYHVDVNWISGCEPDSYYVTTDKSSSAREEEIDAPEGSTVYLIANKRGYVQYETSIENISGPHTFEPPCSIWASVTINNCIGNDMSTSEDSAEHVRNLYARIDNVDASNDNIEWRVEPVGDTPGNATVEPYVDDARKDCGRVTALGAGVVEVFAKSKRNGNEGSCVINIVEEDPIMVSAVTIDPLNMEISVSDTSTSRLRAIVSGTGNYNKAVTWNVTKDGASTDGLTLTPGSLDESGNYTAEIKGNVAGQYTVRAISVQDTNISGQCTILVLGETKNVRLINNSPWTVNYSVGNSSSTITAGNTKELGTVSEDMTIQRVYPDQAKTYFTLENGTNVYSLSGNKSDSYSGDNWIISYADLQSGDIIIDYESGIGPGPDPEPTVIYTLDFADNADVNFSAVNETKDISVTTNTTDWIPSVNKSYFGCNKINDSTIRVSCVANSGGIRTGVLTISSNLYGGSKTKLLEQAAGYLEPIQVRARDIDSDEVVAEGNFGETLRVPTNSTIDVYIKNSYPIQDITRDGYNVTGSGFTGKTDELEINENYTWINVADFYPGSEEIPSGTYTLTISGHPTYFTWNNQ